MGILDSVMDAWGNAGNGTDRSRDAYLQALAGGMLSGRSNNFSVNLGRSMLGAQDASAAERERMAKERLIQAQVGHYGQQDASARAELARKLAMQQGAAEFWRTGGAGAPHVPGQLGPPVAGQAIPQTWNMQGAVADSRANGTPLPAPTMTPQETWRPPTLEQAGTALGRGFIDATGVDLIKHMNGNEKFEPGMVHESRATGKRTVINKPNEVMGLDPNTLQPVEQTGVAALLARAAGLTERARSDATAATDVVTINQNGIPTVVTKQALRGMQPGASMPLTGGQAPVSTLQPAGQKVKADVGMNGNPEHMRHVFETAVSMKIRPDIALRLIGQESNWDPNARSSAGAGGLGQLMPGTARELGVNANDWKQNIDGSLRYFKQQLDANDGDYTRALAAYNAGPGRVRQAGGIPNIPETIEHGQRIMGGPLGGTSGAAPTGAQPGVFPGMDPAVAAGRESVAKNAGKAVVDRAESGKAKASAGEAALGSLDDMVSVLDKHKGFPLVGTGTAIAERLANLGTTLGLTGDAAKEWLASRGTLIQTESKLALLGATNAVNQGAVSNFERELISRASTPNSTMSEPEMRAAIKAIQKVHAYNILDHDKYFAKNQGLLGENRAAFAHEITPENRTRFEALAGKRSNIQSLKDVEREYGAPKPESQMERGRGYTPPTAADQTKAITEARDAIARGAPREAVIKRLSKMGFAVDGLQ